MRNISAIHCVSVLCIGFCEMVLAHATVAESNLEWKMLQDAIAYRSQLDAGRIEASIERTSASGSRTFDYVWYWSGSDSRVDANATVARAWSNGRMTSTPSTFKLVVTASEVLSYDDVLRPDGEGVMATRASRAAFDAGKANAGVQAYNLDPRCVGMNLIQHSGLYRYQIDSLLKQRDGDILSRLKLPSNGTDATDLLELRRGDAVIRIGIDRLRGPSVVSLEREWLEKNTMESMAIELREFDGIWFPQRLLYQRDRDERVLIEETINVIRAEFNATLSPETFTFTGMELPVDHPVRDSISGSGEVRIWDGKQLVDERVVAMGDDVLEAPSNMSRFRTIFIGCNLVVVGVLCAIIAARRRRAAAK